MTEMAHTAETARRPDLLTLVTLWSFVSAFLWTIGLVATALFAYPFSPGYEGTTLETGDVFGMVVGTLLLLGCVGVSMASGVGLLKEKSWGRAAGIANAVLSVFLVPIGTVIGLLALVYLLRPEVSTHFAAVP